MSTFAEYLEKLMAAKGHDAISRVWRQDMAHLGFENVMIGSRVRNTETGHYGTVVMTNYSPDWMEEYNRTHFKIDPVLHATMGTGRLLTWDEVPIETEEQRQFMEDADRAIGLNGISALLPGQAGQVGAMSVTAHHDVDADKVKEMVFARSCAAHMALINAERRESAATYRLTDQQHRVLQLMVDPQRSMGQIAEILCISDNTLKIHSRAIYQTLGVKNRAGAVSEGLLRRLIELTE